MEGDKFIKKTIWDITIKSILKVESYSENFDAIIRLLCKHIKNKLIV